MGNARETERRKRQTALYSDNIRVGTARRTKGVGNPRASKQASERASGTSANDGELH